MIVQSDNLARLLKWCSRRGITVQLVRGKLLDAHCSLRTNVITVPRNRKDTYELLLHECGHWLWWHSVKRQTHANERWRRGLVDRAHSRTTRHKLARIDEEFDAWARGERLGVRLEPFTFNSVRFERTKAKCLRTYLKSFLRVR